MLAGLQHPRNGGDLVFRLRHFADGPRGTWPSDGQCPPPISAFTRMDGHLAYMSKVNVQGRTLSLAPSPVARDWLRRLPPRPQIGNVPSCGPAHYNWPCHNRRTMTRVIALTVFAIESRYIYPFSLRRTGFIKRVLQRSSCDPRLSLKARRASPDRHASRSALLEGSHRRRE